MQYLHSMGPITAAEPCTGQGEAWPADPGTPKGAACAGSLLDLLVRKTRAELDELPADPDDCFYGNPLAFMGEAAPRLGRERFQQLLGADARWERLADMGRADTLVAPRFMAFSARVDARTFCLWALLEYANFIRDPLDARAQARLMAIATTDHDREPALSMRFVKAVWMGYFHAAVAAMEHLSLRWSDVPAGHYPALVDIASGELLKPIENWQRDRLRWTSFVEIHGDRLVRLGDPRLAVRQIASLSRPPRAHGARMQPSQMGRLFPDPPMPSMRLVKDGHKGTLRSPSVLSHLIAACGADALVAPRLLDAASDDPKGLALQA